MDSNRDRELEEELVNRALDLRAEATSTSLTGSTSLTQAEGPEVTILYCVLAEVWIFERNAYFFLECLVGSTIVRRFNLAFPILKDFLLIALLKLLSQNLLSSSN